MSDLNLKLLRHPDGIVTVGELSIEGHYQCLILEDEDRDHNMDGNLNEPGEGKVKGKTCIPYDTYEIILTKNGSIYERYLKAEFWSKRGFPGFEKEFKGMLMLQEKNGFHRCHIHIGTKVEDTEGCLLTGSKKILGPPTTVSGSTLAYIGLYRKVIPTLDAGEKVFITIEKSKQ